MKKKFDYIVVGQGIAGTVLVETLRHHQKSVLCINDTTQKASSLVAGGFFNPLTGKNLVKTWLADEIFPKMLSFYEDLEHRLNAKFFHKKPIYRPFRSIQEQNDWLAKSQNSAFRAYIAPHNNDIYYENDIFNAFGGIETLQAGWVDLPILLEQYRNFLKAEESYQEETFDYNALQIEAKKLIYKNFEAEKIVFCEGSQGVENPFFPHLPFSLVKGETILIKIKEASFENIVNQGVTIAFIEKDIYRVASTYSWQPLDWENTKQAEEELSEKAKNLLKKDFEVIGQKAGIRPATKHRRPIVGLHPQHKNLAILNGLGSKGVSLAPYLAEELYQHIEYQKVLHKEIIQP
ncbi:MAG: FAD-binding oxidoreductase [Thermonemataceae bacterium]|nr:FAD-binding oxidoreductase [Thermonemataceae bacterium]